jgi:ribosomal protein S5
MGSKNHIAVVNATLVGLRKLRLADDFMKLHQGAAAPVAS